MVHQGWLVLDFPIAVFAFDQSKMLSGTAQYGLAAFLDLVTDPGRVDVGDGGREIDARTPGGERSVNSPRCLR